MTHAGLGEMAETAQAKPDWQKFFPSLRIPEGLTFEDVQDAARLIEAWAADECEGEDECRAYLCAMRVFALLHDRRKPS